jgi:hypothetical protein
MATSTQNSSLIGAVFLPLLGEYYHINTECECEAKQSIWSDLYNMTTGRQCEVKWSIWSNLYNMVTGGECGAKRSIQRLMHWKIPKNGLFEKQRKIT